MNHIKNNTNGGAKAINDSIVKHKNKKKRPNSSDMRKNKKGSLNKLIDVDPMTSGITTPSGFYDTII
jgi:hypothetical protein